MIFRSYKSKFKDIYNNPRLKRILISLLTFFALLILFLYWRYYQTRVSTENAYVNANVIQVASQVPGTVLNLGVNNNQRVKKGQLLLEIDPKLFEATVNEALAHVSQKKAELNNAKIGLERTLKLVAQKFVSPEKKDDAETAVDVAEANLKLAEAKWAEAKLNLGYTQIYAANDGLINNLTLRPGTTVQARVPLFVLIDDSQYWVDANFKETELEDIRPNQSATIVLDMYPNHLFHGIVNSVSGSSGTAFSLLPPQNATGNWVKVTQRIPVKILITDPNPQYSLRIGATAAVTIQTTQSRLLN